MDKLLKMLGVAKLDEAAQSDIKEKITDIIEVQASALVETKLQEEKERLVDLYEGKFDEYKEDITSKFSNFVDSVLDEEMNIPTKVLEYAKKGELYDDLIEQFKIRLSIDEGLLDNEVKSILKEAKDEIQKLRDDLDKNISEGLDIKKDAQEMASELYLRQKCDGLTESQKKHVLNMLEGIVEKSEIDRKFKIIIEAYDEDDDNDDDDKKKKEDDDDDEKKGKGKVDIDEKKKEDDDDDDDDDDDKKKKEDDDDDLDENSSPFKQHLKQYVQVLRENKI